MKKGSIFLLFIFVIAIGFLIFEKNNFFQDNQVEYIQINEKKIRVEIASTEKEKQLGLAERENLCVDCGMLFIFEKSGRYSFWMKGMRFNLDILWISGNQVVKIAKNIPYEKGIGEVVNPQVLADKVLEINAGKSDEWGIREGDRIFFDLK